MCNTYSFPTPTIVERTRLSVALYVHCPSCYSVNTCLKLTRKFCHALLFVRKSAGENCATVLSTWTKMFVFTVLTKLCRDKWILTSFVHDATTEPSRRATCRTDLKAVTNCVPASVERAICLRSVHYPLRSTILCVTKFTSTPACRQNVYSHVEI